MSTTPPRVDALPSFTEDGMLPPGDYELTFAQLRRSALAVGSIDGTQPWDVEWRMMFIDNLEVMTRQLWQIGVSEVFADGSFAEDKAHPNDIDGYFVCDLAKLASGELERELNRLDPYKVWTWAPDSRRPYQGIQRCSCRCGIAIGLSCIRTCPPLECPVGSLINTATSLSSRSRFASLDEMATREEL